MLNRPTAVGRFNIHLNDGIEDRDPAAEKWPGFGKVDTIRNFNGKGAFRAHQVSKATMPLHDGPFGPGAEIMITGKTLRTSHASSAVPTDPHLVPLLEMSVERIANFTSDIPVFRTAKGLSQPQETAPENDRGHRLDRGRSGRGSGFSVNCASCCGIGMEREDTPQICISLQS